MLRVTAYFSYSAQLTTSLICLALCFVQTYSVNLQFLLFEPQDIDKKQENSESEDDEGENEDEEEPHFIVGGQ